MAFHRQKEQVTWLEAAPSQSYFQVADRCREASPLVVQEERESALMLVARPADYAVRSWQDQATRR